MIDRAQGDRRVYHGRRHSAMSTDRSTCSSGSRAGIMISAAIP